MIASRVASGIGSAVLALAMAGRLTAADPLAGTTAQFQALHALIKPHEKGPTWRDIPWMTDLHEARKKAAAEGKPLFVWAMAGEPLGSA